MPRFQSAKKQFSVPYNGRYGITFEEGRYTVVFGNEHVGVIEWKLPTSLSKVIDEMRNDETRILFFELVTGETTIVIADIAEFKDEESVFTAIAELQGIRQAFLDRHKKR